MWQPLDTRKLIYVINRAEIHVCTILIWPWRIPKIFIFWSSKQDHKLSNSILFKKLQYYWVSRQRKTWCKKHTICNFQYLNNALPCAILRWSIISNIIRQAKGQRQKKFSSTGHSHVVTHRSSRKYVARSITTFHWPIDWFSYELKYALMARRTN